MTGTGAALKCSDDSSPRPGFANGLDFTGVCVVFMCHDGLGNFAMGKRNANCRDEIGRWDIGGGAVRFNESPEEAVEREVGEEYGTKPMRARFLGYRSVRRKVNGADSHWIALDFLVSVEPCSVENAEPGKLDEVRMFTMGSFPSLGECHSQFPAFLDRHKGKIARVL